MQSKHLRSHPPVFLEILLITALYCFYRIGRLVANGNVSDAFRNADRIWDYERWLRLPNEAAVQNFILHSEGLQRAVNVFYTTAHFPATIAFLIWVFRRHPGHYIWLRRTLTLLTGAALVLHMAFPLAPPRMVSAFGLIDTGLTVGPSPYQEIDTQGLANQFAAMPSLHFGWALTVAIGLTAVTRSPWRWLWLLHPGFTLFVIIATGHHYWLDAITAALLLSAALPLARIHPHRALTPGPTRYGSRRIPSPPHHPARHVHDASGDRLYRDRRAHTRCAGPLLRSMTLPPLGPRSTPSQAATCRPRGSSRPMPHAAETTPPPSLTPSAATARHSDDVRSDPAPRGRDRSDR